MQARTLELYRQIGLADAVVAARTARWAPSISGRPASRSRTPVLGDMGAGLSPFPYALIFPQDEHERLLIDRLRAGWRRGRAETELVAFEEAAGRVLRAIEAAGWRDRDV